MALLEVENVHKAYAGRPALAGVGFTIDRGEILCLLGPSGSGKTTLLRVVAGLEAPDRGRVVFAGRDLAGVEPHRRGFGMMFQEYALFPHQDVGENVAFGLRMQGRSGDETAGRVREVLDLVGLAGFEERRVSELSGGERQRVALARSLAPQPGLLMLDEPLGSLDRALRERLMTEIRRILKAVGVTAVFVTHDQVEAFAVADRVAVLDTGRLEQLDRPEDLYRRPRTAGVARFLGFHNLIEAAVLEKDLVETPLGRLPLPTQGLAPGRRTMVLLRPEGAALLDDKACPPREGPVIEGLVHSRRFQGRCFHLGLETAAGPLFFDLTNDQPPPEEGTRIRLALNPVAMVLIPE
ncbi:MAG: ABC transporter ATP-binding protein [Thermodesulfobacteriota bacterium]